MASWTDSDFWVNDVQNMISSSVARLQSAGQTSYSTIPQRPTSPEIDDLKALSLTRELPEDDLDPTENLSTIEVYDLPSRDIMDLVTDLEGRIADPYAFAPLTKFSGKQVAVSADPTTFKAVDDFTDTPDDLTASTEGFTPLGLFAPTQKIPELDKFVRTAEFEDFMAERHNTYVWYSQQITDLIAEVNSVLTSGGYGVSSDMQQSLFDQDIERKLQALDDSLLRLNA